ncbi:MAG: pantothenate kinase [Thermoplasmatales archaeon]|nr:pantothenate kinase [Thermoplasmatales archaeon]
MTTARCPGHVTCFFRPVDGPGGPVGSLGVGIRLSMGAVVSVEPRRDAKVDVTMDGAPHDAPITKRVLGRLMPGAGADVTVVNELPVGMGFGMTAAGAIAAGLCACGLLGLDEGMAYSAANEAELALGGGRGDVAAIMSGFHVPVRIRAGMPPEGEVVDSGLTVPVLSLAVLGTQMPTGEVLGDPATLRRIRDAGDGLVDEFLENPSLDAVMSLSRGFSAAAGVESPEMSGFLDGMRGRAAMCMLGNSAFSPSVQRGGEWIATLSSTDEPARIIRKG